MPRLDTILASVFGFISLSFLSLAVFCFLKALRVSNEKDGDIKMVMWAACTLIGLVISGMSAAYILLPILIHYW